MTKDNKSKNKFSLFKKGTMDYSIIIVVAILVVVGLVMVLSASSATALAESGNSYKYFMQQLKFVVVGVGLAFVISRIDYKIYRRLKWVGYFLIVPLLLAVKFRGLSEGGATRWIEIGGFVFQPSELAKVVLIVFFASLLTDIIDKGKIKDFKYGFLIPLVCVAPIAFIILFMQNHFSATLVIALILCVQMFVAGVRTRHFVGTAALAFVISYMSLRMFGVSLDDAGFRGNRIKVWLDPFADVLGDGWQIVQSLYAIGSGGIFGAGLGKSRQKYLYLSEPQNDFIFAVFTEEFGLVGCLAVIALFALLIYRGAIIAKEARDTFGKLIATGIVALFGIQIIINIAVVTGTMPVTGMQLPFFSYGGTSMICNLMLIGLLLSVSRCSKEKNNT